MIRDYVLPAATVLVLAAIVGGLIGLATGLIDRALMK